MDGSEIHKMFSHVPHVIGGGRQVAKMVMMMILIKKVIKMMMEWLQEMILMGSILIQKGIHLIVTK